MDLNTLWFILVTVLFVGFFFLEGFDYGVGILLPFVGKNDQKRREVINTIGPFWDGNEVWLLTAGGAIFAAFPEWYATMFSGFYLALFVILFGLIIRGVGFEFRSKVDNPTWRNFWDWMIFTGSILPALLFGVAFANILHGLNIDSQQIYRGTFFDLLNPYSLFVGVVVLVLLTYHGALFLTLRTTGEVLENSKKAASRLAIPVIILAVAFFAYSAVKVNFFEKTLLYAIAGAAAVSLVLSAVFLKAGSEGKAFSMGALTVMLVVISMFVYLFPNVMISNVDAANNLTIYNASSSAYTLKIMSVVAAIFVPIVLLYQSWTYWTFRKRITADDLEY